MDAGRELDALVAEKVLDQYVCRTEADIPDGWKLDTGQSLPGYRDGTFVYTLPYFSTDLVAAWMILDQMVWRVGTADIRFDMEDYGRGALTSDKGAERAVWVTIGEWTVCGPAPWAICEAALAAMDATPPSPDSAAVRPDP